MRTKSFIIPLAIILFLISILFGGVLYAEDSGGTEPPPEPAPEQEPPPESPAVGAEVPEEPSSYTEEASVLNVQQVGNSGAAHTGIPIVVPPGRNAIAPNLALTYNSSGGNGQVGVGWSLDVGAIQRNTKHGVCYECNDYVAIVNGSATELISRPDYGADCYGEKIERSFSKYCMSTAGWEVTTKNGTKHRYGHSSASRQDFEGGVKIFRWCLDEVRDTNGNYMTILYDKDINNGEIYIEEIRYTGNGSLSPSNKVIFEYDPTPRNDDPPMYVPNHRVVTTKRLLNIKTFANNDYNRVVRRYALQYAYSTGTKRSILNTVTIYGDNDSAALPEVTFTYQQGATNFGQTYTSGIVDTGVLTTSL
ncbi:MAG: SpvB/TcaC N-terminal domain-containing protein [Nitrospirota bacterium]